MFNRFSLTREQPIFLQSRAALLPDRWREKALQKHAGMVADAGGVVRDANIWLLDTTEPLEGYIDIAANDEQIKALADALALAVRERIGGLDQYLINAGLLKQYGADGWAYAAHICQRYGVEMPENRPETGGKEGQILRLTDSSWWLRNLRISHAKAREAAAIDAGVVHKKSDVYCSDDTLERRGQQKIRNEKFMREIEMKSIQSGQIMTLEEIAKLGMANQELRRGELMTRIDGMERLAIKENHRALFVTVTCPARMHAVLKNGQPNPKYDGTKPDEAQKWLVKEWAKIRAALHRRGVNIYGLRVAEPHHDGTPHWHLILFCESGNIEAIKAIFQHYILADADNLPEREAAERRKFGLEFVQINPLKGSAAGYVAKYVSKNIGGIPGEDSDEAVAQSETLGARVEAWAAVWRIRQFQQIGGHSVTVWRECRRVPEHGLLCHPSSPVYRAYLACNKTENHKADFAEFLEALGGVYTKAREGLVQIMQEFEQVRGKYGQTIKRMIKGVQERFGQGLALSARENWVRV